MQETQEVRVWSLHWEDMATHSSILAWKIPWTKETGRLQVVGLQRVEHDWTCRGQVGNWVVVVNQVIIKFPKIMESVVVGHPNFVTISLVTMFKLTSTSWTSSLNSTFSCFSGNSTLMSNKNLKCAQFFPHLQISSTIVWFICWWQLHNLSVDQTKTLKVFLSIPICQEVPLTPLTSTYTQKLTFSHRFLLLLNWFDPLSSVARITTIAFQPVSQPPLSLHYFLKTLACSVQKHLKTQLPNCFLFIYLAVLGLSCLTWDL